MTLTHPFEPVFDNNSEILILGTFPSVKSREFGFYYGHPRNRFWNLLAAVYREPAPVSITEKKEFLLSNGLALWDAVRSCEITGSDDASIRNPKANDISFIINNCSRLKRILCNGGKAFELYTRLAETTVPACKLPSTSPANAAWSLTKLVEFWREPLLSGR